MSSNLVKSLARVYDPKPLHAQKRSNGERATARRASLSTSNKHPSSSNSDQPSSKSSSSSALVHIEGQVNDLSDKMDKLLALQEASLKRLDSISQDQGTAAGGRSVEQMLCDVRVVLETVRENEEQQDQRLDALERLVKQHSAGCQFCCWSVETLKIGRSLEKHTLTIQEQGEFSVWNYSFGYIFQVQLKIFTNYSDQTHEQKQFVSVYKELCATLALVSKIC